MGGEESNLFARCDPPILALFPFPAGLTIEEARGGAQVLSVIAT